MARAHRRGVLSASVFIPSGTFLGSASSLCFRCFLAALVEPRNDDQGPLVLLDRTLGFTAPDLGTHTTHNKTSIGWLTDIRPAQNCYEQNVEITRMGDKAEKSGTTSLPFCEHHGNRDPDVGPLRFQAFKDITIGSELLAWPDLLLGLSIGLPFLTIQHIKIKKNNTLGPTCYYCTECGLGFAQPNALKSHLFLAACGTGDREVDTNIRTETLRHTCTFCGRRYARRYSLVIHQRTHTGHKPLICRVCARRFGDPSNLNKHLRTHGVGIGGSSNSGPFAVDIVATGMFAVRQGLVDVMKESKENKKPLKYGGDLIDQYLPNRVWFDLPDYMEL
ncbi:zinc finger C2H2 type [Echinococcus multilocularis]|uniref:Zinc finger C2H2 type n=1 Tax=Echinococcus multilocularis TaxID=6211 RepID=A0A068Y8K2_ECHMU|nr:zinc finger C2H2 type [Echinococcus multilocularis]